MKKKAFHAVIVYTIGRISFKLFCINILLLILAAAATREYKFIFVNWLFIKHLSCTIMGKATHE